MAENRVTLTNVRLSFPNLFKAKSFQGSDPKFGATFLLDKRKHKKLIAQIESAIDKVKEEKWGKKPPRLKGICLRDGEEKEDVDGYGEDVMFVSSSNAKRPQVVDRDRSAVAEEDNRIYPGCYVNAVIGLWAQDNDFGKRVNANLLAVQFVKDGDAFGEAPIDVDDAFDDLEDDEDDEDGDEDLL